MRDMSYDAFCTYVQEQLQKFYGKEAVVKLQSVQKVNGVLLRGITVHREECNVMPTLYLEHFFDKYESGMAIHEVIKMFIDEYESAKIHKDFDISFFEKYEKVRPHLGYKLINYDMNWQLLQETPHKRYLDLAIVCYCTVNDAVLGKGGILIRNEHLDMWNLEEKTLLKDALENMQKIAPPQLMNMSDILKDLYEDEAELIEEKLPMYVLTNKDRMFGAGCLLYDNVLEKTAMEVGGDYYILPSSLHEVIIVPKKEGTDEMHLSQMVNEISHEQLEREEILSNHAYLYSHLTKELSLLPMVPYEKNTGKNYH